MVDNFTATHTEPKDVPSRPDTVPSRWRARDLGTEVVTHSVHRTYYCCYLRDVFEKEQRTDPGGKR